jgi:hypothetical protein
VSSRGTLLVDGDPSWPPIADGRAGRVVGSWRARAGRFGAGTSSTAIVHDHDRASEESGHLEAVFDRPHAATSSQNNLKYLEVENQIVDFLDSLHPARGSVLIDTFYGFAITTQAANLKMFVVTSDRDFKETVADPVTFHVKYIVVPDTVHGALDAINVAYPTLYANGAGVATMLREFKNNETFADWRVYEVNET